MPTFLLLRNPTTMVFHVHVFNVTCSGLTLDVLNKCIMALASATVVQVMSVKS